MSKVYERKLSVLFSQIDSLAQKLLHAKAPLKDPIFTRQGIEDWGRSFGNTIHDMPVLWAGSASIAAIQNKLRNPRWKPSKDHYHSRQRCGEELATLIIKCFGKQRAPAIDEVIAIVERARQVHYVTERENQKVRPYMAAQMTPAQAYKAAGIDLQHNTQDLFSKRGRKTKQWKKDMVRKYG